MKVTDLSHLVTNGMPVFPGTPELNMKAIANLGSEGFNELQILVSTHTGTHIDCPLHIIDGGFDTTYKIDQFYGRGIVLNCLNEGSILNVSFLRHHEDLLSNTDYVLFYTGWDKYWGRAEYFGKFPILSEEAAGYMVGFKLKGTGIDAPGFDPVDSVDLPVHHILLSEGIILVENLTNLKNLPEKGFTFSCLPLKFEKGDGSPVRAAAITG